MIITTKLKMDLDRKGLACRVDGVQGDVNTRVVELALFAGGAPWQIPEGVSAQVRFRKSDRTGGVYDTLPDGTQAWQTDGNVLSVTLAPQMLTAKGEVKMQVELVQAEKSLATFLIFLDVEENPATGVLRSTQYVNMRAWLTDQLNQSLQAAMESGAFTPQLQIDQVTTLDPGSAAMATIVQDEGIAAMSLGIPAGATPEKGVDYWTEAEQATMRADVKDELYPELAQLVQSVPEFANDLEECTDTSKLYVLPDGMLYAYQKVDGALYTNLADPSGEDWAEDSRLNSSGSVVSYTGGLVTNWIDVQAGDVLRVKGLNILDSTAGYMCVLKSDGATDHPKLASFSDHFTTDEDGVIAFTVYTISESVQDLVQQIRLSGMLTAESASDVVITLNAQIVEGQGYCWKSTGHAYQPADYEDRILALEDQTSQLMSLKDRVTALEEDNVSAQLPEYWQEHLSEKITMVNGWQEAGGKDCFSFPVLTDLHATCNLGMRSGLVARAMMDGCQMKYALCLGDVVTRGAATSADEMKGQFAVAETILSPIRDRLLQTQGNHDGSWGAEDLDADGDVEGEEYYCYNFTPELLHSLIYRKVGLVGDVHFDTSGSGYYIDDVSNKVRYILLNSHNNAYAENTDGTAMYNNMRLFRFGQTQFDLLIQALTSVPGEDWAVITASHGPINDDYATIFGGSQGEHVLLRKTLQAYKNKQEFSGSFSGTYDQDAVSVSADFSQANGQHIAHFAGHSHEDSAGVYDDITVITTRCDAQEENEDTLYAERVAGTVTEQSFDIFTVNRKNCTIYATKIGAGTDREIPF